jgi:hypothetical protein
MTVENMKNVAGAAVGLCKWCHLVGAQRPAGGIGAGVKSAHAFAPPRPLTFAMPARKHAAVKWTVLQLQPRRVRSASQKKVAHKACPIILHYSPERF